MFGLHFLLGSVCIVGLASARNTRIKIYLKEPQPQASNHNYGSNNEQTAYVTQLAHSFGGSGSGYGGSSGGGGGGEIQMAYGGGEPYQAHQVYQGPTAGGLAYGGSGTGGGGSSYGDYDQTVAHVGDYTASSGYSHAAEGTVGKVYGTSAELTNLAHTSALQAKNAVQNQLTAGSQAAFGAKSNLALAAVGAATTAQAALVGKQVIVQGLKHQLQQAEEQLAGEIKQYHQADQASQAAQATAEQARQQVNALAAALASTQAGAQAANKAAAESAGAAAAQHAMIQDAKQRVAHLTQELHTALSELKETEASAQKAATAAHIAQSNVAQAANDVASSAAQVESHVEHGSEAKVSEVKVSADNKSSASAPSAASSGKTGQAT